MDSAHKIKVEIAFALPDHQYLVSENFAEGTTLGEALKVSHFLAKHPEIPVNEKAVGIWSKVMPLDTPLRDGDRIEIYRPLLADPKTARRNRAQKDKSAR